MTCRELITRSVDPEIFRILGVDLLPLTIGHIAVLDGLGFLDARDPAELAVCVLVCSSSHRVAMRRLRSQWFQFRSWWWGVSVGKWDFAEKRQAWADYLTYHTELPYTYSAAPSDGQSVEIPIPSYQIVRTVLISRLGYDPETVDDTPFVRAQWDRLTLAALDGRVRVLDKTEADIDAEMDAIDWDKVEAVAQKAFERQ